MIFLLFTAGVLILYGVLCFVAIEAIWRISVPETARGRIDRRRWNLITRIAGAFAIAIGLAILGGALHN